MNGSKLFSVALAAIIALAVTAGCENMGMNKRAPDDDDRDENEQPVAMDQLPPAVRATLTKEAGQGKIEEIDKLTLRGRTVYEADVILDGKKWELRVREDGQFLRKELDEETDGEDDKHDDDDNRK